MPSFYTLSFRTLAAAAAMTGAMAAQAQTVVTPVAVTPATAHAAKQARADAVDNLSTWERNALRRCAIHKEELDRMACVGRVRDPKISGSVEGGGLIREHEVKVVVPPPPPAPRQ